ncbi:hypothetical protein [Geomonas ferrireducens]|uniref:hypothetical protein n=1 Tax=Geomonas ferrireducens TaxID=2570227 RepID=UPI0010A79EC9|nr:hypothetical protein [Geomonas ferrireducens]
MIAVYGSLFTIVLCIFLPPLFDSFFGNNKERSWKRSIGGYALVTGLGGVVPVLVGGSAYLDWLFVILGIAIAVLVTPISFIGTFFVLLLLNVILPVLVLWDMARCIVKEPVKMLLGSTDFTDGLRLLTPILLGLATFYVGRTVRQKFRGKERSNTDVD